MARAYWSAKALSRQTTTSDVWSSAVSLNWTPTSGKSYLVLCSLSYDQDNNNVRTITAIREGGTTFIERRSRLPSNDDADLVHREIMAFVYTATDSVAHTFNVGYRVITNGGNTIGVQDVYLTIIELQTNDRFAQNLASTTTTSTSYQTRATLNLPSGARDYLLMYSAALRGEAGTTPFAQVRGRIGASTTWGECDPFIDSGIDGSGTGTGMAAFSAVKRTVAGGETVVAEYCAADSGDEAHIDDCVLVALALDGFPEWYENESRGASTTTSTSFVDKVQITKSLPSADFLLIETALVSATGSGRGVFKSQMDGVTVAADAYRARLASQYQEMFGQAGVFNFTAGSHTRKIRYRAEAAGNTAAIKDAGIYLLRLGSTPTHYEEDVTVNIGFTDAHTASLGINQDVTVNMGMTDSAPSVSLGMNASANVAIGITDAEYRSIFYGFLMDETGEFIIDENGNYILTDIYGFEIEPPETDVFISFNDDYTIKCDYVINATESLAMTIFASAEGEIENRVFEFVPHSMVPPGATAVCGLTQPYEPLLAREVIHFASESTIMDDAFVDGRLMPFTLDSELRGNGGLDALPVVAIGDLSLSNADGGLDMLADQYLFEGRKISIMVAETDGVTPLAESDFSVVASGVIDRVRYDERRLRFEIRDSWARMLQKAQQEVYLGTGGIDGQLSLKGMTRPLTFGRCFNVPATQIDPSRLVYQVHRGDVRSIDAIYDAGVSIPITRDVATYDELHNLVPQSSVVDDPEHTAYDIELGTAVTCKADGVFRLAGLPVGVVTADVQGAGTWIDTDEPWDDGYLWDDGTGWEEDQTEGRRYNETPGAIIVSLLTEYGPFSPQEVDADAFFQIDTETPRVCGIHLETGGASTYADAISALCASVGIVLDYGPDGVYRPNRIAAPGGIGATVVDDSMILADRGISRADLPWGRGSYRQHLRYRRNHRTMADAEVAGSVSQERRSELAQQFSEVDVSDHDGVLLYPSLPAANVDTALWEQEDALDEARRRLAIYTPDRRAYRVKATRIGYRLRLGDTIMLKSARFGLSEGKTMTVSAIGESSDSPVTDLTVWG